MFWKISVFCMWPFQDSRAYLKRSFTVSTAYKATSVRLQKLKATKDIIHYSVHNYSSEMISFTHSWNYTSLCWNISTLNQILSHKLKVWGSNPRIIHHISVLTNTTLKYLKPDYWYHTLRKYAWHRPTSYFKQDPLCHTCHEKGLFWMGANHCYAAFTVDVRLVYFGDLKTVLA